MTKHYLWAGVVLVLAFLAAFVGLSVSGSEEAAKDLGFFCAFLIVAAYLFLV